MQSSTHPGPKWQTPDVDEPADGHASALPPGLAQAAAQVLDLRQSRQLVYVGGDGEVLAVLLDNWPQLVGVWFGPAYAQDAAQQFFRRRGLADRMRYVAGETLEAIPAGDLVVFSAVDAAIENSLRLLVSAESGWLPADGRWLILKRESPHLSSLVDPSLLQAQGLRVTSRWQLSEGVHMLVCAPAYRFIEALADRAERATAIR